MKRSNQTKHDQLVEYAINFLIGEGFSNVKADLRGCTLPNKITWTSNGKGHIPDVTAKNGQLFVFEVETADSINDLHTADQWELFSKYVSQHGGEFWVLVPAGSESDAQNRFNQLRINNGKIWAV